MAAPAEGLAALVQLQLLLVVAILHLYRQAKATMVATMGATPDRLIRLGVAAALML
jgi:hypothetical protein